MMDMDIPGVWRSRRADAPGAGAQLQTSGEEITIGITQQCQVALPSGNMIPEINVTVTSNRPGILAQVTIAANLNSPDGSYQGPTTTVGQGQFTATSNDVHAGFLVLPSGWPVLGVGAEATWADGAQQSFALNYVQLECDPWVWWRWLIPIIDILTRRLSARSRSIPPAGHS
jgi:hypothetical protein